MSTDKLTVLAGMRPTGPLHLGNYHGVLKNFLKLQAQYECYFFVADWHALTTDYENPVNIRRNTFEMLIDWLASGVDPKKAHIFIQSQVPEIAELHVLLSMLTPLSWLEHMPTYKDQLQKLNSKDLSNYGFLGYPLLQTADVLAFRASYVPVGEDQVPHIEFAREIARRFNRLYGRSAEDMVMMEEAFAAMKSKDAAFYRKLVKDYQEKGDAKFLEKALALLEKQTMLSAGQKNCLRGFLEGGGRIILPEPQALLTPISAFPGLDGQKMSSSYGNEIYLREDPDVVADKIKKMPTDPARVRKTDKGDPKKCPVWKLHKIYSDVTVKGWVETGCKNARIGCIECKKCLSDQIIEEQAPIRKQAKAFEKDPNFVHSVIKEGVKQAKVVANETVKMVREVMGIAQK